MSAAEFTPANLDIDARKKRAGAVVLVADDDPAVAALVAASLADIAGVEVITAGDGYEALTMAWLHRPDLAILDISMPGVGGIDVCRRIKGAPETRTTRVIILTAHSLQRQLLACLDAGADEFVRKPFSPGAVVARVRTLLGS